jgi:hypothetical protein
MELDWEMTLNARQRRYLRTLQGFDLLLFASEICHVEGVVIGWIDVNPNLVKDVSIEEVVGCLSAARNGG